MQRIHQVSALLFVAFSAFVMKEALDMEYYTRLGPGAGFFPFWLGGLLGALAIVWLFQVSRRDGGPRDGAFFPNKSGLVQIGAILASLLATAGLMTALGFQLTMFLFLLFLLRILGRQKTPAALIVALLGSVGVFHIFGRYLDVPLPVASLSLLAKLGL